MGVGDKLIQYIEEHPEIKVIAIDGRAASGKSTLAELLGAYSLHPIFGDYADLKVFLDVDPPEQMRRIAARNGNKKAEMFRQRWIPVEERYFKEFQIREKADWVQENQC